MIKKVAGLIASLLIIGTVASGSASANTPPPNWCRQQFGKKAYLIEATLNPQDRQTYEINGNLADIASLEVSGPKVDISNPPVTTVTSGVTIRLKAGHKSLAQRYTTDPFWVTWDYSPEDQPYPSVAAVRIESQDEIVFLERAMFCVK